MVTTKPAWFRNNRLFALARSGRGALAPVAVAGWIGAAYWATSSTSSANPAVTIGRAFSDTFAGIAPGSVPGFVVAPLAGGGLGADPGAGPLPGRGGGDGQNRGGHLTRPRRHRCGAR